MYILGTNFVQLQTKKRATEYITQKSADYFLNCLILFYSIRVCDFLRLNMFLTVGNLKSSQEKFVQFVLVTILS